MRYHFNKDLSGYAEGFPEKFELGLGIVIPLFVEGIIRYEFTPKDNKIINISFNTHLVKGLVDSPFLKYGITASRAIGPITPFLSYYQYGIINTRKELDFQIVDNQTISFGWTIPVQGLYLIPELDYQFSGDELSSGWPVYGIGLRIGKN
jgi:hypothetical protein